VLRVTLVMVILCALVAGCAGNSGASVPEDTVTGRIVAIEAFDLQRDTLGIIRLDAGSAGVVDVAVTRWTNLQIETSAGRCAAWWDTLRVGATVVVRLLGAPCAACREPADAWEVLIEDDSAALLLAHAQPGRQ